VKGISEWLESLGRLYNRAGLPLWPACCVCLCVWMLVHMCPWQLHSPHDKWPVFNDQMRWKPAQNQPAPKARENERPSLMVISCTLYNVSQLKPLNDLILEHSSIQIACECECSFVLTPILTSHSREIGPWEIHPTLDAASRYEQRNGVIIMSANLQFLTKITSTVIPLGPNQRRYTPLERITTNEICNCYFLVITTLQWNSTTNADLDNIRPPLWNLENRWGSYNFKRKRLWVAKSAN
jgi:hypothetical protein